MKPRGVVFGRRVARHSCRRILLLSFVLLDVFTQDAKFCTRSAAALLTALKGGDVIASDIVPDGELAKEVA